MEQHNIDYWTKAKVGDSIQLSDVQTIEQCMIEDRSTDGIYYPIKTIHSIKQMDGLCSWLLFELGDNEDKLTIMVKSVDNETDIRVYYALPGIEPGCRSDMINDGFDWIFDRDCQEGCENQLNFTNDIVNTIEDDNGDVEQITFLQKRQGELFGKAQVTGFDQQLLVTVVEYSTDYDCENPEMLIYEIGEPDSDGMIYMMEGCNIHPTEVSLI